MLVVLHVNSLFDCDVLQVTFSCGKGVDQEIWYDKEAEEVFTPTFMELALEKKDGTHKSKAKKHCSS